MIKRALCALAVSVLLVGCRGTVQVGIERTPTPNSALTATLESLVEENQRLATQVAAQAASSPLSPDLGQLAYVQGGDIWFTDLSAEPSQPRRLTSDGHNLEPRWSPSGRWLAFRKERALASSAFPVATPGYSIAVLQRQVWLIQADGNGEHPLNLGSSVEAFAWSPTDDRLAYTTAAGGLSIIGADGTNPVTLVSDSLSPPLGERQVGRISWSPDGDWIAYELRIQPADRFLAYQGLWMVSPNGGSSVELYNSSVPNKGEALLAGWSSSGAEVLFLQSQSPSLASTGGTQLYVAQADPDGPRDISPSRIVDEVVLNYPDFVAPAPRNPTGAVPATVAFVAGEGRNTWENKFLWSTGQQVTGADMAAISPAWSPDGTRLAFTAMPDQSELSSADSADLMQRRIWVANAYGAPQLRRLTDTGGYRDERPLWSADGNYLLFARMDARGRASLWIIASRGGLPHRVVDELTPAPEPSDSYGHVDWDAYFHWWRGS